MIKVILVDGERDGETMEISDNIFNRCIGMDVPLQVTPKSKPILQIINAPHIAMNEMLVVTNYRFVWQNNHLAIFKKV